MVKVFVSQILAILTGACLFSDFGNAFFINQLRENCQPICRDGPQVQTVPVYCRIFFRDQIKCRKDPEELVAKLEYKVSEWDRNRKDDIEKISISVDKSKDDIEKISISVDKSKANITQISGLVTKLCNQNGMICYPMPTTTTTTTTTTTIATTPRPRYRDN